VQNSLTRHGLLCDGPDESSATPLMYKSGTLFYNGLPLLTDGDGWAMYVASASQGLNNQFLPAPPMPSPPSPAPPSPPTPPPFGPAITPRATYTLYDSVNSMYCMTAADSTFIHCEASTMGLTRPEAFYFFNPLDDASTVPLPNGQQVIMASAATGKYCRVAQMTASRMGIVCDQGMAVLSAQKSVLGIGDSKAGGSDAGAGTTTMAAAEATTSGFSSMLWSAVSSARALLALGDVVNGVSRFYKYDTTGGRRCTACCGTAAGAAVGWSAPAACCCRLLG
jgi:hypothetical protein